MIRCCRCDGGSSVDVTCCDLDRMSNSSKLADLGAIDGRLGVGGVLAGSVELLEVMGEVAGNADQEVAGGTLAEVGPEYRSSQRSKARGYGDDSPATRARCGARRS